MIILSLKSEPNIILWLSAIRSELHRHHPYDVNLVRSLFESAVDNAGYVCLWSVLVLVL